MRLAEVRAMTLEKWRVLRQEMHKARKLPKLDEHFRKHGGNFVDFGIATPEQYEALFLQHVQRQDLELFTYVTTQKGKPYRYWALVGMDNGAVALYNETKQQYWSFLRHSSMEDYLRSGQGWWLKVSPEVSKLKVRRW